MEKGYWPVTRLGCLIVKCISKNFFLNLNEQKMFFFQIFYQMGLVLAWGLEKIFYFSVLFERKM